MTEVSEDSEEHLIHVKTETNDFTLKGRPCEVSAFSFVPTDRNQYPAERNVFNSPQKPRFPNSTYDRMFHGPSNYNNKLHRDDRAFAKSKGLTVNDEEIQKVVPTLASSDYGKRLENNYDPRDRKHVRVAIVQSEFFRRTGINAKETNSVEDL